MEKDKLDSLINNMVEIIVEKNEMYGSSVFEHGELGLFIRLSDKFSRLRHIIQPDGEQFTIHFTDNQRKALNDTVLDIFGYSILWLYLINFDLMEYGE